jgi:hypothetical protein
MEAYKFAIANGDLNENEINETYLKKLGFELEIIMNSPKQVDKSAGDK